MGKSPVVDTDVDHQYAQLFKELKRVPCAAPVVTEVEEAVDNYHLYLGKRGHRVITGLGGAGALQLATKTMAFIDSLSEATRAQIIAYLSSPKKVVRS